MLPDGGRAGARGRSRAIPARRTAACYAASRCGQAADREPIMKRAGSCRALLISLLAVAGCSDAHAFHYAYQGQLLAADGAPAAAVDLYVIREGALEWTHGDKPEWNYSETEHWAAWGTRTDAGGRFSGTFNGEGTYSKWLGVVPPTAPPAKVLDAVYVVVRQGDAWVPILVRLEPSAQLHGSDGERQIELPPVTLPSMR